MTRNVLKTLGFTRAAFAVAAGIPFLTAVSAFAQEPSPAPAGGTAEVERVIVTGSNIPTAEEVGPNPVDTYRSEDIRRIGVRTTTDLVQRLPGVTGFSINQNISNGGDGRVEINLRGIFPKETLVLIDGRRVAPSLNGTALGGTSVDIGPLPFELVDHVDILKDGASAIYGSDAVAGVFNVFFYKRYRGLEVGYSYGNTNAGASNDAAEQSAYLLAGTGDDKTDIVVFAKWEDRAAIYSVDRGISQNGNKDRWGGFDARSGSHPGRQQSGVFIPNSGTSIYGPNTPTPHSFANVAGAVAAGTQYQSTGATNISSDRVVFNFARLTPDIPDGDKQNLYASYVHDICDKYLTVYADFRFARSFFNSALAPVPFVPDPFLTAGGAPLSGQVGISVPTQNAFSPFTVGDTVLSANNGIYAGLPVTTQVRYRALGDVPRRQSKTTFTDYMVDFGLRGEMGEFGDYFKTWNWETNFRYDDEAYEDVFLNAVSKIGLREALADTNPATAFNVFGIPSNTRQFDTSIPKGTSGPPFRNTKIADSRVFVTLHHNSVTTMELEDFKLSGDLWNLPAGPIGFALGVEHRRERYRDYPDSLNTTFSTIGSTDLQPSRGVRDVWGTYQEVRIPVTSPTWNVPYVLYSLEFDVAEREEWYASSVFGVPGTLASKRSQNDSQRPKFSVRWSPFDDSLVVRASYSEAFHVPYLNELSPQGAETFPSSVTNSTSGSYQFRALVGGNPSLRPEVAYDWSYGAVWTPKYLVKGLTLSATQWHVHQRDLVSPLSANFIAQHCEMFPGFVLFQDGSTCSHEAGNLVSQVNDQSFNLGSVVTEGLDFEASQILDTPLFGHGDFGTFTFTLNGTYVERFIFQSFPQGDGRRNNKEFSVLGRFADFGSLPQMRFYTSLFWDGPKGTWMEGIDAGVIVHYSSQYHDTGLGRDASGKPLERKIREWTPFDLQMSYTFNLPAPAPAGEVAGLAKDGGKSVKMNDGKEKNIMPVSTAEYNPCGWRAWLNGTTIALGMNNVMDLDPPFVAGAFENGYDESAADVKGRFWYAALKKKF